MLACVSLETVKFPCGVDWSSQCRRRMLRLRRAMVPVVSILGRFHSKQNLSPRPKMLCRLGGGRRVVQRL